MTVKIVPKLLLLTGVAALTLSLSACSTQAKDQAASQSPAASNSATPTDIPTTTPETPKTTPVTVVEGDRPQVVGPENQPMVGFPKDMQPPAQNTAWIIQEGTGRVVESTDTVTAVYAGQVWGKGELFDASYLHGTDPISFSLTRVIPGWTQGLTGQKVGSKLILSVPPDLGYGPSGGNPQAGIGVDDTIVFYIEIVDAQPAQ